MTSLCSRVHIILTNRKEGNVHPLKWRVNKTQLVFVDTSDWNVFRFIPSIEIFRFTMLIWKTRYLAQINEDVSEIPNQIRSLRQLKSAGLESLLL
ncbi:hypothetical protein RHMOL_Rhmol04G0137400 [Rhododendron molle]|uniref:Uncharacterized protein n=1 Tax=Rhododendron molle TaxID=49168 RepID=A0ACC0P001_RHOML|nr:hypothetical protein RHMOL_Rhmol04G0137400 [Rhododendron molle]